MLKTSTKAFTSYKARLQGIHEGLPKAHQAASEAATRHILGQVTNAAREAGWKPGTALQMTWDGGQHHVAVAPGSTGDRIFDREFGTPEKAPNPVLRTTAHRAKDQADLIYRERLLRGLGIR